MNNNMDMKEHSFFVIDENELTEEDSQFLIGFHNGFLPRKDPLIELPKDFNVINQLLNDMPLTKKDGSPGLLAMGTFGDKINSSLPNFIDIIQSIENSQLLSALFRDYTFIASAYLLEPCHLKFLKDGTYGFGRDTLPPALAVPLCYLAEKLNMKPFMEYASCYALYNYKRKDPSQPITYSNLELIRTFEGSKEEHGFILVHVAMVAHTGRQVKATLDVIKGAKEKNRDAFNHALLENYNILREINNVMETMWKRSSSERYNNFRTFIMGTKNQPMFPNGIVYEGVSKEPRYYRGESGANDSIIPTLDNLLELTAKLPNNPLTAILKDFRSYRPIAHNRWLSFVEEESKNVHVKDFALKDPSSSVLFLQNLEMDREFRSRHWFFTKDYILKYSKHPVATGGSPIVTWLPNQLFVVLHDMDAIVENIDMTKLNEEQHKIVEFLKLKVKTRLKLLEVEVETISKEFPSMASRVPEADEQ